MRSVFRGMLVALVGVLAVGAVASASALAAPKWEVQEGGVWKALGAGESRNVVATGTDQLFYTSISGVELEVKCEKIEAKGSVENMAAGGSGEIKKAAYSECHVVKPAGCEIKTHGEKAGNIRLAGVKTKLVELKGGGVGDELYTAGGIFVELEWGTQENAETHKFKKACGIIPSSPQRVDGEAVAKIEGGSLNFTNPPQEGNNLEWPFGAFRIQAVVDQELEGGGAIRAS